jgi:peptidoglycan/xylan/chitin deacetylase (PgdA/CDA1 family)
MMKSATRERVRICLGAVFYYSGLVRFALWWRRRSVPYLVVLNYHQVAGGNLREQMRYLNRHYRILDLQAALNELYADAPSANSEDGPTEKPDSRSPLVLTFDDGYLDSYMYALPYAQELGVPIALFPIPVYIDSGATFWWLAPGYLVKHTRLENVTLGGKQYRPTRPAEREALLQAIDEGLRHAGSVEEREAFLADAERSMQVPLPRRGGEDRNALDRSVNWTELQEMDQSGLVSFGVHTMHHTVLAYLSDDAEIKREVEQARRVLEGRLGRAISAFAYPVGKMEDIGERGVRAVREAGYSCAFTTIEGVNTRETDRYLLRRLPGRAEVHWLVVASELAGLLGVVSRFRKWRQRALRRGE